MHFPKYHVVGIIQCIAFSDWLLLFSNIHLRLTHVFCALIAYFFLSLKNIPLYDWTAVNSVIEERLTCFQFLQLYLKLHAVFCRNISFHISWVCRVWVLPGSYVKTVFNFGKKLPNCFLKWCHSYAFSPSVNENSFCFASSPVVGGVWVLTLPIFNK